MYEKEWFRMPIENPDGWRHNRWKLSKWQRIQVLLYRWSHWYE